MEKYTRYFIDRGRKYLLVPFIDHKIFADAVSY